MDEKQIQLLLKEKGLRTTDIRVAVLTLFWDKEEAASAAELEKLLPQFDRVTVYRTLHTFVENKILHAIPCEGATRFARSFRQENSDSDCNEHIHFKCNACYRTICLASVPTPKISLPNGYSLATTGVVAEGVCKQCSANAR